GRHCRTAGVDWHIWIVVGATDLAPFAGAINVGLPCLKGLLKIRRADEMVIAATRIGQFKLGLDARRDDLEFETLVPGCVVTGDKPLQAEHSLGTLNDELGTIRGYCHHGLCSLLTRTSGRL